MALYYNASQSPLPLTLEKGVSVVVPPRGKISLVGEQASSPAVLRALSVKQLVQLPAAYEARQQAQVAVSGPAVVSAELSVVPAVVAAVPVEMPVQAPAVVQIQGASEGLDAEQSLGKSGESSGGDVLTPEVGTGRRRGK